MSVSRSKLWARLFAVALGVMVVSVVGCDDEETAPENQGPAVTFPTSLHATGNGKPYWYDESPNMGFERFTNIPYSDLSCQNCHQPECTNCHDEDSPEEGAVVTQDKCQACHGRQNAEANHYTDVHRTLNMECMDCHAMTEVHGDGTEYNSMLEDGAIVTRCENCHDDPASLHSGITEAHLANVDCSACHVQSVVTCYNCHFEDEVDNDMKTAYGQFKDWLFLVNYRGKVHVANFQSVKYGDNTFVAMAPFYAHTVSATGRSCADCHDSDALNEYDSTGEIDVVTWNGAGLDHVTGVVPVPPDYLTALNFDFVNLVSKNPSPPHNWEFLKAGADTIQMLFATPLTQAQIDRLINN